MAMWQKKVKQPLVGLGVKSSPLGSRQGWQQPHQTFEHARVLCQVVSGQQTRVRQKARGCSFPGQACAAQPLGLPDPPCPWDSLHSSLCPQGTFQLAPVLFALLPIGTESCTGNGRTSPTYKLLQGSTWPSSAPKTKQQVLKVRNIAGHVCVY